MCFKIGQSYTWREIYVSIAIRLSYSSDSWKEIYVSNLKEVFTEARLEDVRISKTQPFKCFACMDLVKSEE